MRADGVPTEVKVYSALISACNQEALGAGGGGARRQVWKPALICLDTLGRRHPVPSSLLHTLSLLLLLCARQACWGGVCAARITQ